MSGEGGWRSGLAYSARAYILAHYASTSSCSTRDVAAALRVSPSHLCHCYRRVFGVTIGQDLRRLRIRRAQHLLACTDLQIKEVADRSGFSRLSYRSFLNAFRTETGLTPRQYRRRVHSVPRLVTSEARLPSLSWANDEGGGGA